MEDERREFSRFVIQEDEIQIFSDDPILFGKICDISKGGLSFRYTPIIGVKMVTNSVNVLPTGKDNFNIYHIGCRTIYDISSIEEGQSFSASEIRRCGIKYSWLKEKQKNKLKLLWNHYVVNSF